ncbi:hypothetical protein BDZ91DRAFT_780824 [Kalaharituber pfeilii]|nr:hypothetical protein BDZ91DRAFT_780824 [Kalaharituber pfeilii]
MESADLVHKINASTSSSTPQSSGQNLPSNPTRDQIEGEIRDLQTVHKESKEKQWKYTNRHGERVAVVERIGPILKCIESYSNIVDVAIQHNPKITALVWASVRAILRRLIMVIGCAQLRPIDGKSGICNSNHC